MLQFLLQPENKLRMFKRSTKIKECIPTVWQICGSSWILTISCIQKPPCALHIQFLWAKIKPYSREVWKSVRPECICQEPVAGIKRSPLNTSHVMLSMWQILSTTIIKKSQQLVLTLTLQILLARMWCLYVTYSNFTSYIA